MNLESQKIILKKSAKYVFESLCVVQNFEKLMPENTSKFEVTSEDSFIFGLKGMPEIKLRIKEKNPNSKIILGAASDKLPFVLIATIESMAEEETQVQLFFEGEFNAMMAMMIKGPISKFIETLVDNMVVL